MHRPMDGRIKWNVQKKIEIKHVFLVKLQRPDKKNKKNMASTTGESERSPCIYKHLLISHTKQQVTIKSSPQQGFTNQNSSIARKHENGSITRYEVYKHTHTQTTRKKHIKLNDSQNL